MLITYTDECVRVHMCCVLSAEKREQITYSGFVTCPNRMLTSLRSCLPVSARIYRAQNTCWIPSNVCMCKRTSSIKPSSPFRKGERHIVTTDRPCFGSFAPSEKKTTFACQWKITNVPGGIGRQVNNTVYAYRYVVEKLFTRPSITTEPTTVVLSRCSIDCNIYMCALYTRRVCVSRTAARNDDSRCVLLMHTHDDDRDSHTNVYRYTDNGVATVNIKILTRTPSPPEPSQAIDGRAPRHDRRLKIRAVLVLNNKCRVRPSPVATNQRFTSPAQMLVVNIYTREHGKPYRVELSVHTAHTYGIACCVGANMSCLAASLLSATRDQRSARIARL